MNEPTERVWRSVDCQVATDVEGGKSFDTITFGLLHAGQGYAVSVTGPTPIDITVVSDALRAALYYVLRGTDRLGAMAELKVRQVEPGELTLPGKLS